ncbi:MAG: LapA family protein [Desulfotomaculaceae bacterium]|nr:LapA family protein [Desulfotomaculaceae bacterium]
MIKAQVSLVMVIVFALIVSIFAIQNTERVDIYFLFWQIQEVSKVLIILVSAASGALIMLFLGLIWQYKQVKRIRRLETELKHLEKTTEANNEASPSNYLQQ